MKNKFYSREYLIHGYIAKDIKRSDDLWETVVYNPITRTIKFLSSPKANRIFATAEAINLVEKELGIRK